MTWARRWHALTAVVALVALALQLLLIVLGEGVLVETDKPTLVVQLGRYLSYFTIQSNTLVAVASVQLARDPCRDGALFRAVRLAGVVGITVTGVVHFTLLRPLLDLDGGSWVADKLLHMAVPLLVLVGWVAFGPRPRVDRAAFGWALAWPVAWIGWTLAVGVVTGWFPYPFLDVDAEGWGPVLVGCVGLTVLFLAFFGAATLVDRRVRPTPASG